MRPLCWMMKDMSLVSEEQDYKEISDDKTGNLHRSKHELSAEETANSQDTGRSKITTIESLGTATSPATKSPHPPHSITALQNVKDCKPNSFVNIHFSDIETGNLHRFKHEVPTKEIANSQDTGRPMFTDMLGTAAPPATKTPHQPNSTTALQYLYSKNIPKEFPWHHDVAKTPAAARRVYHFKGAAPRDIPRPRHIGVKQSLDDHSPRYQQRLIKNSWRRISTATRTTGIPPAVETETTLLSLHGRRQESPPPKKFIFNAQTDTGTTRRATIGAQGDQAVSDKTCDAVSTAAIPTCVSRIKSIRRRSKSDTSRITENHQIAKEWKDVSTIAKELKDESDKSVAPLKENEKEQIVIRKPVVPHVIATYADVNTTGSESAPPVYMETDTKMDYGRLVVLPNHGIHPEKKKTKAEVKKKIKTKGEANKHLKTAYEYAAYDYSYEENVADEVDIRGKYHVESLSEERDAASMAPLSPVVVNAADHPQIMDDREFNLVPDAIKRIDDPYLKDVEDDYKVAPTNSGKKKEKKKQKDDRKKEIRARRNISKVFNCDD